MNEDLDRLVDKACDPSNAANPNSYRCHLDGDIVQDDFLKIACLKVEESGGTGGGGPSVSLVQVL
eukprot:CAMPEP_0168621172 /NCGR_PEP_ID=MMETSP0449_2-20121227/7545_1 /TAXON_ID=1082188 /ORGANISM="Strombidium rassoulzadegani, Strain ras09" /LENGTH=64 /DNA_ID=CAMNT_0008662259 /DNA_START=243 /DNA_END=437 /DNA_ORIENTATION=-